MLRPNVSEADIIYGRYVDLLLLLEAEAIRRKGDDLVFQRINLAYALTGARRDTREIEALVSEIWDRLNIIPEKQINDRRYGQEFKRRLRVILKSCTQAARRIRERLRITKKP